MIYPRQTIYSLEALGYMATQPVGKSIKVRELAEKLNIPRHFLGKVLTELVKKRFVSSTKGPSGGFVLAVNPADVTVYRILSELEALTKIESNCVMGLTECDREHPCVLHAQWKVFKENAVDRTQELTLYDFSKSLSEKLEYRFRDFAPMSS
jgi:Rrf2 family iron-sulfur cluster assembly transcriptional regulator